MEVQGKVWKDLYSSWWIAEISFLDVITQGKTKTNALEMIKDAVMELLKDSYNLDENFFLAVHDCKDGIIKLQASDYKLLIDFGSKRKTIRTNGYIPCDEKDELKSSTINIERIPELVSL